MRRLEIWDYVLLGILLPIWILCFALHVYHVRDSGSAIAAVFATAGPDGSGYPVLGGFRPDRTGVKPDVRPGDKLLRVGDRDLRGVGYLDFEAVAASQADANLDYVLEYERDGERRTETLALVPDRYPWTRIPALVVFSMIAIVILVRSSSPRTGRAFFMGAISLMLIQMPTYGRSYGATLLYFAGFAVIVGPTLVLALRWAILFPDKLENKLSTAWAWLMLPIAVAPRLNYIFGVPLPTSLVPTLVLATDAVFFTAVLGIMTRNYLRSDPIGRRQLKWLLLGLYLGVAPLLATTVLGSMIPGFPVGPGLGVSSILFLVMPACFLIGVLRFGLFDIDRLLSATAAYSGMLAAATASILLVVPRFADGLARLIGIDADDTQLALSLAFAAGMVPLNNYVRPRVDRLLFPAREAVGKGVDQLLLGISACAEAKEIPPLVGERVAALFGLDACQVYQRLDGRFEPAFFTGPDPPEPIPADSQVATAISKHGTPFANDPRSARGGNGLDPFARAALESLGAAAVMPYHVDLQLAGFGTLGPKTSGDIYTETDLSHLRLVGERTASKLAQLEGAAHREALEQYVPGAIAEQIASGEALASGAREVSVLFVDIRGYTGYAKSREADEIFSVVNRYTELVSTLVREQGGSVVEFNGDGMMAVFGAPNALPDKEGAAVRAGVSIHRALAAGAIGADDAGDPLRVGVGVATGEAFVGNIRAADRLIWSAIGNPTNLAARLQSLTRDLGVHVIIDETTYAAAPDAAASFERRAEQPIRGRGTVDIYVL